MLVDLTPQPGRAPYPQMIRAQAGMELRLLLRNGEQLLLALVIPILVLVGGVGAASKLEAPFDGPAVDTLTPGVLALAIMSTAFTSLAIATGFERRYGVIKRLGTSPLPRVGLLMGKVLALVAVQVLQFLAICTTGWGLGWEPTLSGTSLLAVAAITTLATAAFAGLGLAVAGTFRAEATLALANLVYLLLMAGGAVVLPASAYGWWAEVATLLPSGALGEGLRAALIDGRVDTAAAGVLALWAALGLWLVQRFFTWE